MKTTQERHIIDVLFVLALFGIFAFSALMLVMIGANVYQNTVDDMSSNFDSRTATAYITEKLRQGDVMDSVSLEQLEGTDTIVLSQDIEGQEYCTYLYFHNGNLMELFMRRGADLVGDTLGAGQAIMPLTDMKIESLSDSLFSVNLVTAGGEAKTLLLTIHSKQ